MSVFDHSVEYESRPTQGRSIGLPDSPELERQLAAEMRELGFDPDPTDDEIEAMAEHHHARHVAPVGFVDVPCRGCGTAIYIEPGKPARCTRCGRRDDGGPRRPGPAGAMFPEVVTWPDDHLTVAITLCEQRHPGLNLHAVGNLPDRHDQFLHEVSAELVRRLESRGVKFAA